MHDDLVRREFTAQQFNLLWLTDTTEHPTAEGKLYLCAVKDTASISSGRQRDGSVPLGKYWRSGPLVFSFVPRCHGLCGSGLARLVEILTEHDPADLWLEVAIETSRGRARLLYADRKCRSRPAGAA